MEEINLNFDDINENQDNEWSEWGAQIYKEVENNVKEVGDCDNAYYLPLLAERLLKDINVFPLWSCVSRNDFGYGQMPASSAAVKGEFNKLKNNILKIYTLPMRVDEFLKIHLDYLHGKLKIVDARENTMISKNETNIDTHKNEIEETKSIEIIQQATKCPGCNNNDMSTSAHVCVICQIPVHAIEECSLAYDKEGYGQKRICLSCSILKSSEEILAMQKIINWRRLNNEKKIRTAKYLGQNQHSIQDSLAWSKSTKLPIIKNGSTMKLQAVCIEGTNYSLMNTCAFDSLLQIVLVTLSDYKHFATKVQVIVFLP